MKKEQTRGFAELLAVAKEFVRRVEAGEVRSVRTYAAFVKAIAIAEGKESV